MTPTNAPSMLPAPALCLALALALSGCAQSPAPRPAAPSPFTSFAANEAAPTARPCPTGLPEGTRCLGGQDSAGSFYLIAMPKEWNGHLVVHAHGGPLLHTNHGPRRRRSGALGHHRARRLCLGRIGVRTTRRGRACRRGRHRARAAHLRAARGQASPHDPARPELGRRCAAKAAETYAEGRPYDAVLLTAGVLGGGSPAYEFRADLRAVYQYLCRNHPRADEPQYPLWMGLPAGSTLTRADLAARARECLGIGSPAAERTPEQAARLKTVVDVIRIPETSVLAHLNLATFHFQDISARRTGGRGVFSNDGAVYRGSADDTALNAGVARFAADPQATRAFAEDTAQSGRIPVPVLTAHAINDPTAFVELEDLFRQTVQAAGGGDRLVQTFADFRDHSYMSHAVYPPLFDALIEWVETGRKPTPRSVAESCEAQRARWSADCRFRPDHVVPAIDSRIAPRPRLQP